MKASLPVTVLLTLLTYSSTAALAATCTTAEGGVCKDVQEDGPESLELLQFRADRAQPERDAGARHGKKKDQAGDHHHGAAGLSKPPASLVEGKPEWNPLGKLGDITGKIVPGSVSNALDIAALAGITSIINSTLVMLSEKAQELVENAKEYEEELMGNVSAAADSGIEVLKSTVTLTLDPLTHRWSAIAQALAASVGPVDKAMQTFGLRLHGEDKLKNATRLVTQQLLRVTVLVDGAANVTGEKKDELLVAMNASVQAGLMYAVEFQQDVVQFLRCALVDVGMKLGVDVTARRPKDAGDKSQIYDSLDSLIKATESLAAQLQEALDSLFNGTYGATKVAVDGPKKSQAASLRGYRRLLLLLAWIGLCGL
mmetsp:Transcript_7182/g.22979  ORF Transcript_7182/g.22979 Transcript_7182/m.22979 type:complete len:370 (+) Transcript_7182:64-1173(+)